MNNVREFVVARQQPQMSEEGCKGECFLVFFKFFQQTQKLETPRKTLEKNTEGCEGVFLYSLISIREKVFSISLMIGQEGSW